MSFYCDWRLRVQSRKVPFVCLRKNFFFRLTFAFRGVVFGDGENEKKSDEDEKAEFGSDHNVSSKRIFLGMLLLLRSSSVHSNLLQGRRRFSVLFTFRSGDSLIYLVTLPSSILIFDAKRKQKFFDKADLINGC